MKKMKTFLFAVFFVLGMACLLPTTAKAANVYYVNTASSLNIRQKASDSSKVVISIPKEAVVQVTSTANSKWYKVVYRNSKQKNFVGYAYYKYLKKASYYTTTDSLYLRASASINGKKVTVLPKSAKVIVVNTSNAKWYKLVYYNSKGNVYRGYASKSYLKAVSSTSTKSSTYYATTGVYMHSGAKSTYKAIAIVPEGKAVTVTGKSGNWYKCTYKTSTKTYTGYIYYKYLIKK